MSVYYRIENVNTAQYENNIVNPCARNVAICRIHH